MNDRAVDALFYATVDPLSSSPAVHELHTGGIRRWVPATDLSGYRRVVAANLERGVMVSLAPRLGERDMVSYGCCLWARVEGSRQVKALQAFGAKPSIVLREGELQRATAVWALMRSVDVDRLTDLNRRVAHALGAVKKHGKPEALTTAPGATVGRHIVGCLYLNEDNVYEAEQFGRLRKPPEPSTAWKERVA